jgi:transposase
LALGNWVKQDRQARGETTAAGLSGDERAELARLRRENAEPAMERDRTDRSRRTQMVGVPSMPVSGLGS